MKSARVVEHAMDQRHIFFFAQRPNIERADQLVLIHQAADRGVDVSWRGGDPKPGQLVLQANERRLEHAVTRSESAQDAPDRES